MAKVAHRQVHLEWGLLEMLPIENEIEIYKEFAWLEKKLVNSKL